MDKIKDKKSSMSKFLIMTRITKNIIESFAIELLDKLGNKYVYATDIAPDSEISVVVKN